MTAQLANHNDKQIKVQHKNTLAYKSSTKHSLCASSRDEEEEPNDYGFHKLPRAAQSSKTRFQNDNVSQHVQKQQQRQTQSRLQNSTHLMMRSSVTFTSSAVIAAQQQHNEQKA